METKFWAWLDTLHLKRRNVTQDFTEEGVPEVVSFRAGVVQKRVQKFGRFLLLWIDLSSIFRTLSILSSWYRPWRLSLCVAL